MKILPNKSHALLKPVAITLSAILLSACANGGLNKNANTRAMHDETGGVCIVGSQATATTKSECFALKGLFQETDTPEADIAAHPELQAYRATLSPPAPPPLPEPTVADNFAEPLADDPIADIALEEQSAEEIAAIVAVEEQEIEELSATEGLSISDSEQISVNDDVIPESLSEEEQADCYLLGSDEPFKMRASICVEGGGSLTKP